MGEEELKQEKMQVLYEYEETSKQLSARYAQAQRIGDELRDLGQMLHANPQSVFFNGEGVPPEIAFNQRAADPDTLNVAKIKEVAGSIRELQHKLKDLGERKKRFGY